MRFLRGEKLLTPRQYMIYRLWHVIWLCIGIGAMYYWHSMNIYMKICCVAIVAIGMPDGMLDLFKSYARYKQEWDKHTKNSISCQKEKNNREGNSKG